MTDANRLKKPRDVLRSHLIKPTSEISKVPVVIDRVATETMEINLLKLTSKEVSIRELDSVIFRLIEPEQIENEIN